MNVKVNLKPYLVCHVVISGNHQVSLLVQEDYDKLEDAEVACRRKLGFVIVHVQGEFYDVDSGYVRSEMKKARQQPQPPPIMMIPPGMGKV